MYLYNKYPIENKISMGYLNCKNKYSELYNINIEREVEILRERW